MIQWRSLPATLLAVALAACSGAGTTGGPSASARSSAGPVPPDAVAVVDGVPITWLDVSLRLKNEGHGVADTPENRKGALETVIRQELAARRALELGLDDDPAYQAGLRALQAQLDNYRRKELAERFYDHEARSRPQPSEAEVRAYYEQNAARFRVRLRVLQIFRRSKDAIDAASAELASGTAFEEVAARGGTPAREGKLASWDLGFMTWQQVPEAWRAVVYDLQPGQTSGVITGPNKRFWIIKLVEREEGEPVPFEAMRDALAADLARVNAEAQRAATDEALRKGAVIQYLEVAVPPPPSED